MLRATTRREQDIAILALHGDATEETGAMLPGLSEMLDAGARKIILNMEGVRYVNSAGLSRFVESYKGALRKDAKMALAALQPQVLKIFKLARVEVFIPIYPSEAQAFKHFGVMVKEVEGPPREQILVVEPGLNLGDEIQRLLASQKEQVNYRISRVPSVQEAIRFLELRPTNVIVLDLKIPTVDNEWLLAQIRTNPNTRRIPVIVATPDSTIVDADWLIRNGADDLIRLPLSPYELSSRLRTALTLFYAMANDDSQLAKLHHDRLQSAKYEGSKYPTIK